MIYINAVRQLLDPQDKSVERKAFTIKFVKMSTGAVVKADVVCTSTNWQRDLITFKVVSSGEIRSIHALQIIEINAEEVAV